MARLARRVSIFGLLTGLTVLGMGILILWPLARLLYVAFFPDGAFTTRSVGIALADPSLGPALVNTTIYVTAVVPLTVAIGAVLAWLNERTDARLGWAADILPILPLLVPPLAIAIGWVFLMAPSAGFLNVMLRGVADPEGGSFGQGPLNIYNMVGMIWVTVAVTVPYAYVTEAAALRNMDPALEEASRVSGEGPFGTLRKVTLPAVRNSLATSAVLVAIVAIAIFSVPVIVGSRGGIDVLTVLIFRSFNDQAGPQFDQMIVVSAFILFAIQLAILAEYAITRSGRHATIGGRSRSQARAPLGFWRFPARVVMLVYIASVTLLPLAAIGLVSLQGFWSPNVQWEKLSLGNYEEIFGSHSGLGEAFTNSLILGVATATVLMVIAPVFAYLVATSRGTTARLVNGLTAIPASIPHVVTGVAFLLALGTGVLHGTLLLLFLAYVVLALPLASRSATAAFGQVGRELREASLICGASHLATFHRILLPLMMPGLLAGWVIVFVGTFTEDLGVGLPVEPAGQPGRRGGDRRCLQL
jgi:iron(III) transport system permease protein